MLAACWPSRQVASTEQLRIAGFDPRVLSAAVREGVLVRIRRGVYVRRDVWNALNPWDRDRLRIEAHWLATRGSSVYSHVSAARLLGCSTWNVGDSVHVTVPYSVARSSHGPDVVPHQFSLPETDVAEIPFGVGQIVRATSLDRTVADCARTLDIERAAITGDHALRLGASREGIRAAAERTGASRGTKRIERLLGLIDGRSESPGETPHAVGSSRGRLAHTRTPVRDPHSRRPVQSGLRVAGRPGDPGVRRRVQILRLSPDGCHSACRAPPRNGPRG